jgi:hypothetical protein
MKRGLIIGALVLIALGAPADTATSEPANAGPDTQGPLKVIMATTDDGQRVVLMPDGTWHYVEGPPAVPKNQACRDALWDGLVAYFSDWPTEKFSKDSYIIKTTPREIQAGITDKKVKVTVIVRDDCTLNVATMYQLCPTSGPCTEIPKDRLFRVSGGKKLVEYDNKLMAELDAIADKHRK